MYFNMTEENLNYTLEAVRSFFNSDTYRNI